MVNTLGVIAFWSFRISAGAEVCFLLITQTTVVFKTGQNLKNCVRRALAQNQFMCLEIQQRLRTFLDNRPCCHHQPACTRLWEPYSILLYGKWHPFLPAEVPNSVAFNSVFIGSSLEYCISIYHEIKEKQLKSSVSRLCPPAFSVG